MYESIPANNCYYLIRKYEVDLDDMVRIHTNECARLLKIACETPCKISFWMLINSNKPLEKRPRKFYVVGTGHRLVFSEDVEFLTTVFTGLLYWHVFQPMVNDQTDEGYDELVERATVTSHEVQ